MTVAEQQNRELGLAEFSVVYTDRALNHMSQRFQGVMRNISQTLCEVYSAEQAIVIPGSGTYAMEAVARQFATDSPCLVVRNGWFSFRWSQILERGRIASSITVLKAQRDNSEPKTPFAPAPIDQVVAAIKSEKPKVVFAPHVETASGIILPDDYIKAMSDAVHSVGGIMVLDCIASGAIWINMRECGVDVLISAPQKGWSGPSCCGLAMLSARAVELLEQTESSSFACNLKQWQQIMQAYLNGGHAYHATMPTDALATFSEVMDETKAYGLDKLKQAQWDLGNKMRAALTARGVASVADSGFAAPGVIVSYTDDAALKSGSKFAALGTQIAAGVPLECDEPADFSTFRIGLFGLDKLYDVDGTVKRFCAVLDEALKA